MTTSSATPTAATPAAAPASPTSLAGGAGSSGSATRSGPSQPALRRGLKVAAVFVVIVVGYAVLSAVLVRPSSEGYLEIDSTAPSGTRALASILADRGVDVRGTGDVYDVIDSPDPSTVVVVFPGLLSSGQLGMLSRLGEAGHDVVLVEPDEAVLDRMDLPVTELGPAGGSAVVDPDCELPEARVAGDARIGGDLSYGDARTDDSRSTMVATCYLTGDDDRASLAVVSEQSATTEAGQGRFVVLGGAAFLTNRYLADDGNAALALALLNRHEDLAWLIPSAPAGDAVSASVSDLLGNTFWLVVSQLFAALLVLALWRGRRLGPIVTEQLPVVVRAAETVEGRGRLYAAAQARDRAAAALRESAAAKLADRLGIPSRVPAGGGPTPVGGGPDPRALVASVAEHTGRSPVEIGTLLYGSDMTNQGGSDTDRAGPDDAALLRLALALDDLDRQVGSQ